VVVEADMMVETCDDADDDDDDEKKHQTNVRTV
jgi:hypothetical protein